MPVSMYVMPCMVAVFGRFANADESTKGGEGSGGPNQDSRIGEISIAMIGFRICTRILAVPTTFWSTHALFLSPLAPVPPQIWSPQAQPRKVKPIPGELHRWRASETRSGSSLDPSLAILASSTPHCIVASCWPLSMRPQSVGQ